MNEFYVDPAPPASWQGKGSIPDDVATRLEEATDTLSTTGDIAFPFRATSHFTIGDPMVSPIDARATSGGATHPPESQGEREPYEFYLVTFACSFEPAPSCRFHTAQFEVVLKTLADGATVPSGNAIAYDLFPQRVEDEYKVSRTLSVGPDLKIKADPVEADVSGLTYERAKEYIVYTSRIGASGLQTGSVAWHFARTQSHEIAHSYPLMMVIRKPTGSQVWATLRLSAHIELLLKAGPVGPNALAPIFRKGDTITETPEVLLCH